MPKVRALGRGLDALIPAGEAGGAIRRAAVEALRPNPRQPRRRWDEQALAELASSVERYGVLEPIVVREAGGGLEIVAGERRWRAAMRAGLAEVPVVVVEAEDGQLLEMALAENLQREDLNAWEQAEAFRQLQADFGWTQEELAKQVGKSRSHVANALRVFSLPERARELVREGRLTLAHVKALLEADPERVEGLALQVAEAELSVRDTVRLVKRRPRGARKAGGQEERWRPMVDAAAARWGAPVSVRAGRGRRLRLEITVRGEEELGEVLRALATGGGGDPAAGVPDNAPVPRGTLTAGGPS